MVIGTSLGLVSGYRGGLFDEILMRFFDSLLAIPALLFALLLLGIVGPSRNSILIVIVIVYTPIVARVVRSVVLSVKVRGFVEAARLQGEPQAFILFQKSYRRSCGAGSRSCPALLLCHLPGRFAWFPGCWRAAPTRTGA